MATARAKLTRFAINKAGFDVIKHGGLGVDKIIERDAAKVLAAARGGAPVVTGEYRDSLHTQTVHRPSRIAVLVIADASHAKDVERDHSVLAKALGASSGRRGRKR